MKIKQLLFWSLGILSQLVSQSPVKAEPWLPVFIKEAAYVHRRIYEMGGDCKLATVRTNDFCQFFGVESYAPVFNTSQINPKADTGYTMHTFPVIKYGLCYFFIDVNRVGRKFKSDVIVENELNFKTDWVNKLHKRGSIKLTQYLWDLSESNRHTIRLMLDKKIQHWQPKDYSNYHVKIGNEFGAPLACARQSYAVWLEAFIRGDSCVIVDLHTNCPNPFYGGYWWHVFPAILKGKQVFYIDSDVKVRRRKQVYTPFVIKGLFLTEKLKWFNATKSHGPYGYTKFEHFCNQTEILDFMQAYRASFPLNLE